MRNRQSIDLLGECFGKNILRIMRCKKTSDLTPVLELAELQAGMLDVPGRSKVLWFAPLLSDDLPTDILRLRSSGGDSFGGTVELFDGEVTCTRSYEPLALFEPGVERIKYSPCYISPAQ